MAMAFWHEYREGEVDFRLPFLTDETIVECESKFGIKFPPALIRLLRTQNGGLLENFDFKFHGRDGDVTNIRGIHETEQFKAVWPCSSLFDGNDEMMSEVLQRFTQQAGDLSKVLWFADNDLGGFALNYNRLNSEREPTIDSIFMDEDRVEVEPVADSFEEFLKCQYVGDPQPAIRLEEAETLEVIAQGGYVGKYKTARGLLTADTPIETSWKICRQDGRIIVLSREDWGFGAELQRAELQIASMCFGHELTRKQASQLGPELLDLVRDHIEAPAVEEYDVDVDPACYLMRIEVHPRKHWVCIRTSKFKDGLWKNSSESQVVYTKVHSADKALLERTLISLAQIATRFQREDGGVFGLRRFLRRFGSH